jgi:glycosyltransferase involved in cell wall biosynthesis
MTALVSVVIPTIPTRRAMLRRAFASALNQTCRPEAVIVEADLAGDGAVVTRNRGLAKVTTEWVAFLDDDDTWEDHHLERLVAHAAKTGADLVYPWFWLRDQLGRDISDRDPLGWFGKEFDPVALEEANYIPVTVMVRTEALRAVGGFRAVGETGGLASPCEDWGAWVALLRAGAVFSHLPERSWNWFWHGRNTSGRADGGPLAELRRRQAVAAVRR